MSTLNRLNLTTDHTGLLELQDHATMMADVCAVRWNAAHKIAKMPVSPSTRNAALAACDALNTLEVTYRQMAATLWDEATR